MSSVYTILTCHDPGIQYERRWKASGRSYGVGCVHTGVFPKRNSRCTWVSSSSCTTCASGVKRYLVRSLSYWSHKTLESNKSVRGAKLWGQCTKRWEPHPAKG